MTTITKLKAKLKSGAGVSKKKKSKQSILLYDCKGFVWSDLGIFLDTGSTGDNPTGSVLEVGGLPGTVC